VSGTSWHGPTAVSPLDLTGAFGQLFQATNPIKTPAITQSRNISQSHRPRPEMSAVLPINY
jgi:hypothetical protein